MSTAINPSPTGITDLPVDILNNISTHLTAAEFLSFTNCSRAFAQYRQDPTYWNRLTKRTFRLPVQRLLQANQGLSLYKKLRTQLRLYAWGNLELETVEDAGLKDRPRFLSIPQQPVLADNVGIVSDIQCGDHCVVILNSIGQLFLLGSIDGRELPGATSPRQLCFPPAMPLTTRRNYEPSTAIHQYSTGSRIVLGLADDGALWSWSSHDVALRVFILNSDLRNPTILRMRSGRKYHVLHMKNIGLVYWPINLEPTRMWLDSGEAILLARPQILPCTAYHRRTKQSHSNQHHDPSVGEVTHYLVLDDQVVFTTHLHKIYICSITPRAGAAPFETRSGRPGYHTHLVDLTPPFTSTLSPTFQVQDLQCSHNSIVILTTSSGLLVADIAQVLTYIAFLSTNDSEDNISQAPPFNSHHIPAPQSRTITSLAFGDSHWHTLHSDGTVASLGHDASGRGCLGLGGPAIGPYRGIQESGSLQISGQAPRFWEDSKTIWFEPIKHRWAADLVSRSRRHKSSSQGASLRALMIKDGHAEARRAMGDWFEREGRDWEDNNGTDADLGAFFTVKIAAAGLHSAALVLVDEDKAEAMRQKHVISREQYVRGKKGIVRAGYHISHGISKLASRIPGLKKRSDTKHARYDWQVRGDVLPRLRMESGQVMPGQEEVAN